MIARLLVACLLALALPALAQECEPKTWRNPNAPGSPKVEEWAIDGRVDAWWCPVPAPVGAPAGSVWWRAYATGGLYVLGWDAVKAAAPRVLAASSPWAQFQAERASIAASVTPTAAQVCRRSQIVQAACVSLYAAQLPGYPGGTRADALLPGRCGPVPDCSTPTPLPPVWRTPSGGSSIFPVVGARIGLPIAGRRAAGSAPCDLTKFRYATGPYVYGALASGPSTEAVVCVQAPL